MYVYERDGTRVVATAAAVARILALRLKPEYATVGRDVVEGLEVSTVWHGIPVEHGGGVPLIFQTAVLRAPSTRWVVIDSYAGWGEARRGHQEHVARFRRGEGRDELAQALLDQEMRDIYGGGR